MEHIDRLDSFVLAETFKYLYLLFAEPSDLPVNLSDFVFTTEAHLLPLSLSQLRSLTNATSAKHPHGSGNQTQTGDRLAATSTSDHHGDRDHLAEASLHLRSKCSAFDFETHLRWSKVCSASPRGTVVHQQQPEQHQDSSEAYCDASEGPGLLRGRELLYSMGLPLNRWDRSACSVLQPITKRWVLRSIDLIRGPPRQLAQMMDTGSASSVASAAALFQQLRNATFPILRAKDFRADDSSHVALLRRMGIRVEPDGGTSQLLLKHDQNTVSNGATAMAVTH